MSLFLIPLSVYAQPADDYDTAIRDATQRCRGDIPTALDRFHEPLVVRTLKVEITQPDVFAPKPFSLQDTLPETLAPRLLFLVVGTAMDADKEPRTDDATRGFKQREQADVVLYSETFYLRLERPNYTDTFQLDELPKQLAAATSKRELAVVILSKGTWILPPAKIKETADHLEAVLRKVGFRRVVFQFATGGFSVPIYRE